MIAVIGLGFVGLTTALGLAYKGFKVYGFDSDQSRLKQLKKGKVPFYEPRLPDILRRQNNNNFFICDNLKSALINSKIIFYCVGTPSKKSGKVDLAFLTRAIKESLKLIRLDRQFRVLVIKSSVPPSTAQEIIAPLIERAGMKLGRDIGLTSNPEFLREGYAWQDFIAPDRIVIGEYDKKSGDMITRIYQRFRSPIFRMSLNTAEFVKYLSNTVLSNMISFSNEMSIIADCVGNIDIRKSFNILHQDKRWFGNPAGMVSYVYPGCGFGGYCLPKDTQGLLHLAKVKGYKARLLKDTLTLNSEIKKHFAAKICREVPRKSKIGIMGLSFKPNCDDVRDSPAKDIIKLLINEGLSNIIAYDPMAMKNFKSKYKLAIEYAGSLREVIRKCDALILLTAWPEFKKNKSLLSRKKIYDGRYFL